MPNPIITGAPLTLQFGNQALPNGQGTLSFINLNDGTNWQWVDFKFDEDNVQLSVSQLLWRSRSTVIGRDRKAKLLTLAMHYQEASSSASASLGAQIAKLDQAGKQQLTTDSVTAIFAEFAGLKSRTILKKFPPFYYSFNLEFLCPEPYFRTIASTTYMNAVALNSGSATNTNVTYAGSIWTEPIWTLTIPVGNTAPIQSFQLTNSMSGDTMTITFPGNLSASTAYTITIDAGAMTATDQNSRAYDIGGGATVPLLYGPAGTVQQISATLTPASGTATGCTLTCVANDRWLV